MHVFDRKKMNFHFLNSLFSGIDDSVHRCAKEYARTLNSQVQVTPIPLLHKTWKLCTASQTPIRALLLMPQFLRSLQPASYSIHEVDSRNPKDLLGQSLKATCNFLKPDCAILFSKLCISGSAFFFLMCLLFLSAIKVELVYLDKLYETQIAVHYQGIRFAQFLSNPILICIGPE